MALGPFLGGGQPPYSLGLVGIIYLLPDVCLLVFSPNNTGHA